MLRSFELELMWFWVRLTVATSIALILASVLIVIDAQEDPLPPQSLFVEIDDGFGLEDLPQRPVWYTVIYNEEIAYRACRDHLYGVIPATESEPEYYVCVLAGS